MFRALLCPSSGAHDYRADYQHGPSGYWVPVGWKLGAVSRELLMMGIVMPETC